MKKLEIRLDEADIKRAVRLLMKHEYQMDTTTFDVEVTAAKVTYTDDKVDELVVKLMKREETPAEPFGPATEPMAEFAEKPDRTSSLDDVDWTGSGPL